ncbi:MAG: DUF1080 domain-containing protein [Candidatus Hinthialibacter antarcticus]|nr:DUF1080 domain-containing protein [Candidatus Hinthialibacter antarcticus]
MIRKFVLLALTVAVFASGAVYAQDDVAKEKIEPYLGNWALDLPGGAGWLNVRMVDNKYLDGDILWMGGSVVPVANVYWFQRGLVVTRVHNTPRIWEGGKVVRSHTRTQAMYISIDPDDKDKIKVTSGEPKSNGLGVNMMEFTGKRIPPHPAAPDLSSLKYGEPVKLFNGENLDGWKLTHDGAVSGWFVKDGVLGNDPKQEKGKPHINYGNLRTVNEFEDFNLTMNVKVLPGNNSGVYLRGIYEVQVADTYGKPLDSHNMGAVYSRITPSVNAEKPANEWQTYDITLCDRHITVILNDTVIIDNQPVMGCTGGALTSDEFKPGPLYLQGDHTGVEYKNIILKPIIK